MLRVVFFTIILVGICTAREYRGKINHRIKHVTYRHNKIINSHRQNRFFGSKPENGSTERSIQAAKTAAILATEEQYCIKYKVNGVVNDEHDAKILLFVAKNESYTYQENSTNFLKKIDSSKKTIIFVPGWTDRVEGETAQKFVDKFLVLNYNLLIVDTGKAFQFNFSVNSILNTIRDIVIKHGWYTSAALGIDPIAKVLFDCVINIFETYPTMLNSTHVVGFSLGAHVAGKLGKLFNEYTNHTKQLPRITGLDPAGPCFTMSPEQFRLYETDATYVDVIHTNQNMFGIPNLVGGMDTFLNIGLVGFQPGCQTSAPCSHSRSVEVFLESVSDPKSFVGRNRYTLKQSYVGFGVEPGTFGVFDMDTNSESPFGLGENGISNVVNVYTV